MRVLQLIALSGLALSSAFTPSVETTSWKKPTSALFAKRDVIKMPTNTPMVPYKVISQKYKI